MKKHFFGNKTHVTIKWKNCHKAEKNKSDSQQNIFFKLSIRLFTIFFSPSHDKRLNKKLHVQNFTRLI